MPPAPRTTPSSPLRSVRIEHEHLFVMRDGSAFQKCYRCGELKPADAFAWRRRARNQRQSYCRDCWSEYHREHYRANKERYKAYARERKRRIRHERMIFLVEYFKTHPCCDCGETDPLVLEFDHLRDKEFDVSHSLPFRRWETILAEIAKCEVVCANCHRRRTARRAGFVRFLLAQAGMRTSDASQSGRPDSNRH
jgi:hypothetical protein